MPSTYIVLPTYNEIENITTIIPLLLELPLDLAIVVVDDGSPDGTGDAADAFADAHPERVHVIHRQGKLGLGTAYLAGFAFALQRPETQRIMTMDADFSHHPRYLPAIVEKSAQYDLVIGSRYVKGGGTPDFPLYRVILSYTANLIAHTLLGLKARDATAGFRCYRREVLEKLPLERIFSSGYSFLIEMLFLVQRAGFTIGEVPIIFMDRTEGASKISRIEIGRAMYTVLRLAFRRLRLAGKRFFRGGRDATTAG